MKGFWSALWTEGLKVRRSTLLPVTFGVATLITLMLGFMQFILKDPEMARKAGLIGTKAAIMAGQANWSTYHEMLSQVLAVFGILGFGFISAWVFGREYSDRTIKDLLALPVARHAIVAAKLLASALWCAALAALVFPLWAWIGHLLELEGLASGELGLWTADYAAASALLILLCPWVAFAASAGRGFMAPLGFSVLLIALTQISIVLGYGQFFPWAIPALLVMGARPDMAALEAGSAVVLALACPAGVAATMLWWRHADQV